MCPKSLIIVFVLIFAKMADNQSFFDEKRCKKLLLIQKVNSSLTGGLEYIVFGGRHYYLIQKQHLDDPNLEVEKQSVPDERFDIPFSVMVYFNDECEPKQYYLLLNRMFYDKSMGNSPNWMISMNLLNGSYNWSEATQSKAEFIKDIPNWSDYEIDFTISWPLKRSLYVIKGNELTHTILSKGCSKHNYTEKDSQSLKFHNFDSCFIPDDKQIICYGLKVNETEVNSRMRFRSFQIDLKKSEGGLEVMTKAPGDIPEENSPFNPIMNRIDSIAKNIIEICHQKPKSVNTTEPIEEETPKPKEEGSLFWLILVVLLIVVMAFIVIILFCCFKSQEEPEVQPKPNVSPIMDESLTDVNVRSDIGRDISKSSSKSSSKSVAQSMPQSSISGQKSVRSSISPKKKKIVIQ